MHTEEEKFYTAIGVAACVLGTIILYFIITMIRHQRRNILFYKNRIGAEISTLENERKRIATDLHDELGPLLSTVRIQINHLSSLSEADKMIVSSANKHIDDILTKTREISYNLLPNTLVRKGLFKAVEEYLVKLRDVHKLQIIFHNEADVDVEKEKEINIYRIIQEIIHNTIKHAKATKLIIEFKKQDDMLLLTTADNGLGFDFQAKMDMQIGLGLMNLQSRAEMLNSKFNYITEAGKGTVYTFEIPLNEAV